MKGCSAKGKGGGADCVRFVAGVLDELYGVTTDVARLPPMTSLHNREASLQMVRCLTRAWPCEILKENDQVYPGDIIIFRIGQGPGHVAIASPEPYIFWHCSTEGVVRSGWGSLGDIEMIFRTLEKERWVVR